MLPNSVIDWFMRLDFRKAIWLAPLVCTLHEPACRAHDRVDCSGSASQSAATTATTDRCPGARSSHGPRYPRPELSPLPPWQMTFAFETFI